LLIIYLKIGTVKINRIFFKIKEEGKKENLEEIISAGKPQKSMKIKNKNPPEIFPGGPNTLKKNSLLEQCHLHGLGIIFRLDRVEIDTGRVV
jgi:hypothetical protein